MLIANFRIIPRISSIRAPSRPLSKPTFHPGVVLRPKGDGWSRVLELGYRRARQPRLIHLPGVAFGFTQRLVAEDRHDLVRRAAGFRETTACGLTQPVRLTIER